MQLNKPLKTFFHLCPHSSVFLIGHYIWKWNAECACLTRWLTVRSEVCFTLNVTLFLHHRLAAVSALQGSGQNCPNWCGVLFSALVPNDAGTHKNVIKNSISSQSYETSLASGETFLIISKQPKQLPLCHNFSCAASILPWKETFKHLIWIICLSFIAVSSWIHPCPQLRWELPRLNKQRMFCPWGDSLVHRI